MVNTDLGCRADTKDRAAQTGADASRTGQELPAGKPFGASVQTVPGTNPTLMDSLETFEEGVGDSVQHAGMAVTDAVATVQAAMGETADTVKGAFASLGHAFDLRYHVRQHPWLMLGAAAFVGYVIGSRTRRVRRPSA